MFEIGDIVTIKQLSESDKTSEVFNRIVMPKYQGTSGRITHIAKNVSHNGFNTQNDYYIRFSDGDIWWWLEEWLEPPVSYDAF